MFAKFKISMDQLLFACLINHVCDILKVSLAAVTDACNELMLHKLRICNVRLQMLLEFASTALDNLHPPFIS